VMQGGLSKEFIQYTAVAFQSVENPCISLNYMKHPKKSDR
jgi:hypothetical protein